MSNFEQRYSRENIIPEGQVNPEERLVNEVLADKNVGCICKKPNPFRGTKRWRAQAAKLNANPNGNEILIPAGVVLIPPGPGDPEWAQWLQWAVEGENCQAIWGEWGLRSKCNSVRREKLRQERERQAKLRYEAELQRRAAVWEAKKAAKAGNPVEEITLRKNGKNFKYVLAVTQPQDPADAQKLGYRKIGNTWYLPTTPWRPDGPGPQPEDIITITFDGKKYTGPRYKTGNKSNCIIIEGDMVMCDNSAPKETCEYIGNTVRCRTI
jgi:hypothetical protein